MDHRSCGTMWQRWWLAVVVLAVGPGTSWLGGQWGGAGKAMADEGLWLFNDLPRQQLRARHAFAPDQAWADHLMQASVRFNSGGSASFVSSRGLVLTNHHVGAETLYKLSTPEHNYHEDGFYARTLEEEIAAPDLELNQLVSIEDVTARVLAAVNPDLPAAEAAAARRRIMAEIEKQSLDATGWRSDVVTLYGGARYHLYRYRKYTDVRLVWAPEAGVAFFGGDADNFEYPRYNLDACLFRVYENGKPADVEHYLKWSNEGVRDGLLVFVSGNPGRTNRIFTAAALQHQRDVRLPYILNFIRRREILLQQFGLNSPEAARRAEDELQGIQNSRKALTGMLQGLQDPKFMAAKEQAEAALLERLQARPELRKLAPAWKQIAQLQQRQAALQGQGVSLNTQLFQIAQTLVQMVAEDPKPSAERLREYRDSNRQSLLQQLLSPAPIYRDLEQAKLADLLALLMELRGGDDALVLQVLDNKSPVSRAAELVQTTHLDDVAVRKQLVEGGASAVDACTDPLIQLARIVDGESRRVRLLREEIQEQERQAYAQVAEALFATQGTATYPDATFTLRLAFGLVCGYQEDGHTIPPWTTVGEMFEHEQVHGATPPWKLPARWHEHLADIDPDTQLNFVCTADIIGGNSGSPVVNQDLELVGLIFDGNIQSLTGDYYYSEEQARAVAVCAPAIRAALRDVYSAQRIVDELGN